MPNHRSFGLVGSLLTILSFPIHAEGGTAAGELGIRAGAAGSPSRGVNEVRFVPIGGLDQWISIRGENRRNPVLLVVHGGPGDPQWPQAAKYRPWEKSFTVVQWDQRGTGHTFGRYGEKTPDVSLERITRDGLEVAEYLCRALGKKKIIVLGHSWGSLVAIQMVQRRPDLFAAYVGTGQVASWAAAVQGQFDLLLAKAHADRNLPAIKELEAIGHPDPKNAEQYFGFTKGLGAAMAPADQAWLKYLRASTAESLGVDPKDFKDIDAGMAFTGTRVLPDEMATDLPATAVELHTAFFVIQGRDDIVSPTPAAVAYFKLVKAPKKDLVLIDGAGHFAFMTSSDVFLDVLIRKVRRIAISRGA